MSCEDLNVTDVLRESLEKLKEFEERIDNKIDFISAGGAGGFDGIFQGGSPLDGITSKLKGKLLESKFGSILSKIQSIMGGGFNLNSFLNEVLVHMKKTDDRARIGRVNLYGDYDNYSDRDIYEAYEEFSFAVNSDPDDLIYISKIASDELVEVISEKDELLVELEELATSVTEQLVVLDSDPGFYVVDNDLQLSKVGSEIFDAIVELGAVDVALNGTEKFFDSNSFSASQKHIEHAIDEISPQSLFNEFLFRKSLTRMHVIFEEIKILDLDILRRKDLFENFLDNFKDNHFDLSSDNFAIREIIVEMRKVKDVVDSYEGKSSLLSFKTKNEILASLFSILSSLISTKQDIINDLKTVEDTDPMSDPEGITENIEKYRFTSSELENIIFDPSASEVFFDELVKTINKEEFNVIRKEGSDKNVLIGSMIDLLNYTQSEKSDMEVINNILISYTPRENPDLDSLLAKLSQGNISEVVGLLRSGDWQSIFAMFLNGKFGGSSITDKINCLLGGGANLLAQTTTTLSEFDRVANSFDSVSAIPFSSIEQSKEAAKKDLEKEKEKIGKIRDSVQTAISQEGSRSR